MKCANGTCEAEIPAGQVICPSCYNIVGTFPEKPPRNVVWFMSNAGINGLYSNRTQKYLQPERVGRNWHADTEAAFEEITGDAGGDWHLLVTDVERAASASEALGRFRITHASCVLALIGGIDGGNSTADGVLLKSPEDLDSWLAMMRSLLRLT